MEISIKSLAQEALKGSRPKNILVTEARKKSPGIFGNEDDETIYQVLLYMAKDLCDLPSVKNKSYSEKLKDPRWQKKRLKILERDEWMCQICQETDEMLCVHHMVYKANCDPWDYDDKELLTLCNTCHEKEKIEMDDIKHDFIKILQSKFLAYQMTKIATGFLHMEMLFIPEVMSSVIQFALTDEKMLSEITERYFSHIKEQNIANGLTTD